MSPAPSGGVDRPGAASDLPRLQACLAAEHAVVYGYGVLGARLDAALRSEALLAYDNHRARRDQLAARVSERGGIPAAARAAYDVSAPDAVAALALAVRLEQGMGVRWRDLVTTTTDAGLRRLGTSGLVESAVRAAQWRRRAGQPLVTVALPGAG